MPTANLNFTIPAIGAAGPGFAQDVNDALQVLDDVSPISVKALGATGDGDAEEASFFQDALDQQKDDDGNVILVLAGTYKVSTGLTYYTTGGSATDPAPGLRMIGAGPTRSIIDSRVANGPTIDISGNGGATFDEDHAYEFLADVYLADFGMTTTSAGADCDGIRVRAGYRATFERVRISDLTGDGWVVASDSDPGDGDLPAYVRLVSCVSQQNGGFGLAGRCGTGAMGPAYVHAEDCEFHYNETGQVRALGLIWHFNSCSIAGGGNAGSSGPGILAPNDAAGVTQLLRVTGCELDANGGDGTSAHVDLEALSGGWFIGNRINTRTGEAPICYRFGNTGVSGVTYITVLDQTIRHDNTGTPTIYKFSNVSANITIGPTNFPNGSTGITLYGTPSASTAGVLTLAGLDGLPLIGSTGQWVTTTVSGSGTVTIDLYNGPNQRFVFSGNYTVPFGTTNKINNGQELVVEIVNSSGGNLTAVSFDSGFQTDWSTAPANGKSKSALFRYDKPNNKWRQVGAWSGDMT